MLSIILTAIAAKSTVLLFGGDVMLNGIAPSPRVLQQIQQARGHADAFLANLEIPLTRENAKTTRKSAEELKRHDQWILKADPGHAEFIKRAGIDLVTLANNHAMDYGPNGLHEMISNLDRVGILHAGAADNASEAMRPTYLKLKNGKTLALLSVLAFMTPKALRKTTPATLTEPGIAVLSFGGTLGTAAKAKLSRWILAAHQGADYVIVGTHWGVERKPLPNAYQVGLGRALVDAGADVVWGNHPHVLEGAEIYNGHTILYSCGNLVSSLPAQTGLFRVTITEDGIQKVGFLPARDQGHQVTLLKGPPAVFAKHGQQLLNQLLLKRFPSTVSVPAF